MSQTDAQAALAAAAAQVMVAMIESSNYGDDKTPYQIEQHTCQMATGLLRWFQSPVRVGARPAPVDERLVPNEDFRSPSHALTERIDANAVTFAAAERERMASAALTAATDARVTQVMASDPGEGLYSLRQRMRYAGPHTLSPTGTTPSGARACECGEKWPCSQSEAYRRRIGLPT